MAVNNKAADANESPKLFKLRGGYVENLIELLILAAAVYGVKTYFFTSEAGQKRELFPSRVAVAVKTLGNKVTGSSLETGAVPASKRMGEPRAEISQTPIEAESVAASESRVVQETLVAEAAHSNVVSQPGDMPQTAVQDNAPFDVPEDSVLKRHYFAELAAQRNAISHPYPTDSVLRRHYQQRQIALLAFSDCASANNAATAICSDLIGQAIQNSESHRIIPEDSVLRRHRLSMIRHEIENQYAPCPSDAVLRRHYHQLIQAQIDRDLAASERA